VSETSIDDAVRRRRAEIGGGGLRDRVAGGTIVNTFYLLAVNGLTMVQGVLLARLLGAREYGLWGLLAISFGTLFALAAVGFDDKYIQQDHPDQQAAFEIAFTLQAMLCGLFTLIALVAVPLFSLLYDQPRILLPGILLALAMPMLALQMPTWVFYRRMDFARQRLLEGVNPVVTFVATVALAIAGAGFWALVLGTLIGGVVTTVVTVRSSPYPLRLRYERGALREYATFSWPLFVSSIGGVVMFQVPIALAARTIGAAAVGAIMLASQITQYTKRVDDVVTHALYPAICAVKSRRDLLFESFSKSNRLALLWGFPTGVAAALFAPRAVPLVLGHRWDLAVPIVQILGLSAAVDQIGFNWTAFARARGETRVLAVAAVASMVATLVVGVPALLLDGLPGFAIGIAAGTLAGLVVRLRHLTRVFPAVDLGRHVSAGIAPTAPAAAAVLVSRAAVPGGSTQRMVAEAVVYVGLVAAASWGLQRPLLREAAGYLRRRAGRTVAVAS
jgi:O-antigen/teichoic acid export membrane protein